MELAISFTDQSKSFTLGVEFGRLLEKMERGDPFIRNNGFPVHKENIETIKAACAHHGYMATFGNEYHEWVQFIAVRKVDATN